MLVVGGADGVNIAAQVGDQGIFLVDSGPAVLADKLLQTLREEFGDKPVRFLINTHSHADHAGGNLALAETFGTELNNIPGNPLPGVGIDSHENTLNRLSGYTDDQRDVIPIDAAPGVSFYTERMDFFLNGEPIVAFSAPSAHTDGDVMVWFRSSDVLAAGDVFVMGNYPVLDASRGGSLGGLISAADHIVDDIAVAEVYASFGTRIIPGHGRLTNESEVLDYQLMLTVIRDRVQDMVDQEMSLDEIKAARPTLDYDAVYGRNKPFWTPEMFLEAVYEDAVRNRQAD